MNDEQAFKTLLREMVEETPLPPDVRQRVMASANAALMRRRTLAEKGWFRRLLDWRLVSGSMWGPRTAWYGLLAAAIMLMVILPSEEVVKVQQPAPPPKAITSHVLPTALSHQGVQVVPQQVRNQKSRGESAEQMKESRWLSHGESHKIVAFGLVNRWLMTSDSLSQGTAVSLWSEPQIIAPAQQKAETIDQSVRSSPIYLAVVQGYLVVGNNQKLQESMKISQGSFVKSHLVQLTLRVDANTGTVVELRR